MGLISNNQSFAAGASGIIVTGQLGVFRRKMDSVLLGGWDITIDLPAGRTDCPSSTCRYNPVYDRYQDLNGGICRSCAGRGFINEPRYTVYKCNRRWTNEPFDTSDKGGQDSVPGVIPGNFVRVKTVAAAWDHINQSIGATLDGQKIKLYQPPRYTGWGGQNLYLVSFWERINK